MVIKLHVLRHAADKRQQDEAKVLDLRWDPDWRYDNEMPMQLESPQPLATSLVTRESTSKVKEVVTRQR